MDGQSIRDIINDLLAETFLEQDVIMRTKRYRGGRMADALKDGITHLFSDVGVKQIDASSDNEDGSIIRITLNNGDVIRGTTIAFPRSGEVVITGTKGRIKVPINGPQAIALVSTMRKLWDEYSAGAQSQQGKG